MEKLDRHDITEADAFGQLIALEAGIVALMLAASDSDALSAAWRVAEDRAFTQSSEPNGLDEQRHEIAKKSCADTLARLRNAIEQRASR
jgi:hypothetical protein